MRAIIEPGKVYGKINAPSSKSMTQRAFAAALLHKGTTIIFNAGNSDDEKSALSVIQQLGATIVATTNYRIEIFSNGVVPITDTIECGESGLAARLFTPIAALANTPVSITGSGSLLKRPMQGINKALESLGIALKDFNGYLPITVHGPIERLSFKLDASFGSQFLSGLLFALTYMAKDAITIEVADLKSKPYIDMTLEILQIAGKPVKHDNYTSFYINPALFTQKDTIEINIEGDWSAASNILVAGAIAGHVEIGNLRVNSSQADEVILSILKSAGADIHINEKKIIVTASQLDAFDFDATHCPDLFPILSVLGAFCRGESCIHGVHRLFHKESNRAESISEMLQNFDIPYSLEDDSLFITGCGRLSGTVIDSFSDHRIIMAAAIAALRADSQVDIVHAESVNKSYPGFFTDLASLGATCNRVDD